MSTHKAIRTFEHISVHRSIHMSIHMSVHMFMHMSMHTLIEMVMFTQRYFKMSLTCS